MIGNPLPRHGLQILPYEGGAVFQQDGGYLAMFRDHDANRREFARHSPRDAEAYDVYSRDILRHCRFIRPMLLRTPPDPAPLAAMATVTALVFGVEPQNFCASVSPVALSV